MLVSIDTLRADHLGCYGGKGVRTPRLDALATRGVLFEDVSAPAPMTAPSHATILTGLYPPEHGVRSNGFYRLADGPRTLAEMLRDAGFATGAVIGGFPLHSRFGFGRGFDSFDERLGRAVGSAEPERPAAAVVDAAADALQRFPAGKRFFLFVHLYDPHADYTPPPGFEDLAPYDGEIAYVDRELGRLFDRVAGLPGTTAIAVVSDHGESLGEHGETTHAVFVYQSVLHVPFLLAGPGVPAGARVTAPASLADVAPTLLGLMGVTPPAGLAGQALLPQVKGEAAATARSLYFESQLPRVEFGWAPLEGIRRGPAKLIVAPRPELYRLDRDRAEQQNLWGEGAAEGKALREELSRLAAARWPGGGAEARQELDAEARARLESLGYVGGGGPSPAPGTSAPDPKDRIEVLNRMVEGLVHYKARRFEDAVGAYRQALAIDPGNAVLRKNLGRALAELGRLDEADAELGEAARLAAGGLLADILEIKAGHLLSSGRAADAAQDAQAALAADPGLDRAALTLARSLEATGDPAGASRALEDLAKRRPSEAGPLVELAELRIRQGKEPDARPLLEEALRRDAEHPAAHYDLGMILVRQGDKGEGPRHLTLAGAAPGQPAAAVSAMAQSLIDRGSFAEAALVLDGRLQVAPAEQETRYTLAVVLSRLGEHGRAIEILRALSAEAPGRARVWNALGTALARSGDIAAATPCFRKAVELEPGSADYRANLSQVEAPLGGG